MFSFTRYFVVLSKERQQRIEMCCLDTDLCGRLNYCKIRSSEGLFNGVGNSLLFHITVLSVLWWFQKQWGGKRTLRLKQGRYFNWQCIQQRGKCLIIFPSHLVGVRFFSLSQNRSPHLKFKTRNKSENENWKSALALAGRDMLLFGRCLLQRTWHI